MGADYLEQDVVATADDALIVLHDIHLEDVTDVGDRFPARARDDGHFYARDFALAELRELRVYERTAEGTTSARYPGRFPPRTGRFRIPTLDEELEFVAGLQESTGRVVGVYPEIKRPAWHRAEGIELGDRVVNCLHRHGYERPDSPCFVQCFDFDETRRLHTLTELPLIQLLAENAWNESATDYDYLKTADGLTEIATVAAGIGPWIGQLLSRPDAGPADEPTGLVARAHAAGLAVHPYTFRADDLPPGFDSLESLLDWALRRAHVDGFFTDFPDRGALAVDSRQ